MRRAAVECDAILAGRADADGSRRKHARDVAQLLRGDRYDAGRFDLGRDIRDNGDVEIGRREPDAPGFGFDHHIGEHRQRRPGGNARGNGIECVLQPLASNREPHQRAPRWYKDALLRTVIVEALHSSDAATAAMLTPELAARPLRQIIAVIVAAGLEGFRAHSGLVRAMRQFYQSCGARCRHRIDEIQIRTFRRMEVFLLKKRGEMRHPHPKAAVPLAITVVSSAMREITTIGALSPAWRDVMVHSERALAEELVRVYSAYLGVV
jgi:hypothetical protein